MKNRSIVIKDIEVGANSKEPKRKDIIRVDVNYRTGGINYCSGDNWPRGYYLSISPMTVGEDFTSFIAFTGRATQLLDAKRFSQKKLQEVASDVEKNYDDQVKPRIDSMLKTIAEKNLFSF